MKEESGVVLIHENWVRITRNGEKTAEITGLVGG